MIQFNVIGHLLGYARVSKADQSADLQIDALKEAGCRKVYSDAASGAKEQRPELDRLLDQMLDGDTVVVWKLDRLGRSLRHLISLVELFRERGVAFRSLTEGFDTNTPGGMLVFNIFGSLASFERSMIQERTLAGLAAARARGRKGGRPTVMTPEKVRAAKKMLADPDCTISGIAGALGVSRPTLYRAMQSFEGDGET